MVPKRELTFGLSNPAKISIYFRASIGRTLERDLPYVKPKVTFRSKCSLHAPF